MQVKVGDLLFLRNDIPFNIQDHDLNDLKIGLLLGIQRADGSNTHQEIIFDCYRTFQDIDNVDELINSKQYKVHFPRLESAYWFPEHYIMQMFTKEKQI